MPSKRGGARSPFYGHFGFPRFSNSLLMWPRVSGKQSRRRARARPRGPRRSCPGTPSWDAARGFQTGPKAWALRAAPRVGTRAGAPGRRELSSALSGLSRRPGSPTSGSTPELERLRGLLAANVSLPVSFSGSTVPILSTDAPPPTRFLKFLLRCAPRILPSPFLSILQAWPACSPGSRLIPPPRPPGTADPSGEACARPRAQVPAGVRVPGLERRAGTGWRVQGWGEGRGPGTG